MYPVTCSSGSFPIENTIHQGCHGDSVGKTPARGKSSPWCRTTGSKHCNYWACILDCSVPSVLLRPLSEYYYNIVGGTPFTCVFREPYRKPSSSHIKTAKPVANVSLGVLWHASLDRLTTVGDEGNKNHQNRIKICEIKNTFYVRVGEQIYQIVGSFICSICLDPGHHRGPVWSVGCVGRTQHVYCL